MVTTVCAKRITWTRARLYHKLYYTKERSPHRSWRWSKTDLIWHYKNSSSSSRLSTSLKVWPFCDNLHPNTMRNQPNIIVTGTPGVGKTTHCETLAQNTGLKHLSINDVVKERGCHDGYDDEFKSWIVDEDKVCSIYLLYGAKLTFCAVARLNRRRSKARRLHHRLARLRSLP